MSFPPPPAPIAPPLPGQLALYKTGNSHYPYFTSGDLTSTKAVVLIGGLTAGMGNVPYAGKLSGVLGEMGWKLVQHHWSSAYLGFGVNNLDKDAQEMEDLVNQLQATGTTTVIFLGNSTGCQDIAKFLSTRSHPLVRGGILQAPVSDREFFMNQDTDDARAQKELLPKAEDMIKEGRGWEIVPKGIWEGYGGRLTYERFFSLMGVGGDDDYFSSDIPQHNPPSPSSAPTFAHPLSESFGRFSAPVLALWSEKDEYGNVTGIPPIQERFKAWEAAMNPKHTLRCAVLEGADHEVHGPREQGALMEEIKRFIGELGL